MEFEYLQYLAKVEKLRLQDYYHEIEFHIKIAKEESKETILGIKADNGAQGIEILQNWVTGLALPRGLLYCYNRLGDEVLRTQLTEEAVYIKYNSTDSGNAVMKPYEGKGIGVIFQGYLRMSSDIHDNKKGFYQYGDFPLYLFPRTQH